MAALEQGVGEVGELAHGADAQRVDDLAEAGQTPRIAFVVGQHFEEILAVALGEVGADTDGVFAHDVHGVFDGFGVIVDGRLNALGQKRREHGHADKATVVGNKLEFSVGFIARVFFEPGRQTVRVADRFFRFEDDLFAGFGAHVRQVAHDAHAVHFSDHFAAETREPAIAFIAAGAHQVLRVVAHLHHAHAELFEDLDVAQLVFKRMGILEAENDPGFAQGLGAADVGRGFDRDHQVAVFANKGLAGDNVIDRSLKALPHRHRAVGGREPAFAHVFKQLAVPFGNDQPVDNDAVCVQLGWAHQASPYRRLLRRIVCRRFGASIGLGVKTAGCKSDNAIAESVNARQSASDHNASRCAGDCLLRGA